MSEWYWKTGSGRIAWCTVTTNLQFFKKYNIWKAQTSKILGSCTILRSREVGSLIPRSPWNHKHTHTSLWWRRQRQLFGLLALSSGNKRSVIPDNDFNNPRSTFGQGSMHPKQCSWVPVLSMPVGYAATKDELGSWEDLSDRELRKGKGRNLNFWIFPLKPHECNKFLHYKMWFPVVPITDFPLFSLNYSCCFLYVCVSAYKSVLYLQQLW